MKRVFGIALVCALCVALGLFVNGQVARAEIVKSGTCGTNLTWTLDDAGLLTISGTGKMKNYGERCVDDSYITNAPWGLGIEAVVIKSGVTSISDYAFEGCSSLTGVTIPESVTSIGKNAFKECRSLTSVTIPEGVTSIGEFAFLWCSSLTSITIPDGVTNIDSNAFSSWYTKLYANLNSDASKALSKAGYSFRVPGTNYNLKYLYTDGSITGLEISEADTDATSITIPEGVTSIGERAFFNCSSLTGITIPESVTSIGASAFSGCSGLTSITIPDSVTGIDDGAFSRCSSLTSITIPDSVTSIGSSAFYNCSSLTGITIPDGVTYIGYDTFSDCSSLKSITIPESVTSISEYAFEGCSSLTSITLDSSDIDMFKEAFSGFSNITNVVLLDGSTSIGDDAFKNCSSLTSITIPEGVTSIDDYAFYNCSSLTSITIPEGVTRIGFKAFYNCSSLSSITIPDSVTSIGYYAFYSCHSLTSITIPESETSISDYAFSYCSSLTSITIPEGVTSIGFQAFDGCSSLADITIPSSVTSIDDFAFYNCSSLTSITIPEGVTSISDYAFYGCSNLTSVTIPESVTSIGERAFSSCSSLASITIPEGVTSISDYAFSHCDSLKKVAFLLLDETASISYGNRIFAYISPTVYCYMFTPVDSWASSNGYKVKYLDEINVDTIRTITLPKDFRLACNDSRTLKPVVFPEDHAPIAWASSNPAVVQVANGTVTAVGSGTATVTATIGGVSSSVNIEVYIVATDFTLSESEAWVLAKQPIQLSVSGYEPAGATATITWSSSDVTLAKVNANGLVTTILPGDVTITATSERGISRECLLHLCYPVTAISFADEPLKIGVGHSAQLTANVTMRSQSCVNHLVTFASDDEAVATVNAEGVVTAHASGTANITATAANGVNASIAVTVIDCDIDGHEWGEASYAWSEDSRSATASRVCIYDDAHVETETVTASLALAKAPTDTEMGETLYTAVFDNIDFAEQARTVEDIPPLEDLCVLTLPAGLTAIEDEAFMGDDAIEAVIVPDGCQTIGAKAFANCPNLIYIRIPESVTNLAPDAFEGSNNVRIDRAGE